MDEVTGITYEDTGMEHNGHILYARGVYRGWTFGGYVIVSAEMLADEPALMDFLGQAVLGWAKPPISKD